MKHLHNVFCSDCASLHSHLQRTRNVPFSPHPSLAFLIKTSSQMWDDISSWWFCMSLMISNDEYFFIHLLLCVSFLEKCLFGFIAHFLIGLFGFSAIVWVCIFWILTPCQIYVVCKYLLSFHKLPFHYVQFPLLCRSFSVWCNPICLFLLMLPLLLVSSLKTHCQEQYQGAHPLYFFLGMLVSGFRFKSLIHFEFIFVCNVR